MDMTYTQAVELLESYGVKISSECNGVSVIKACAEIVRNQSQALKKLTEPEKSFGNAIRALKTLRLYAKVLRLQDGDMLWLRVDGVDRVEVLRVKELIKKVTGKNIMVLATDRDDKIEHHSLETQTRLMKKLLSNFRPEVRAQVLQELASA